MSRKRFAVLSAWTGVCAASALAWDADALATPANSKSRPSTVEAKTSLDLARAARSAGDIPAAITLYRGLAEKSADPDIKVEFADTLLQGGLVDDAIGVYLATPPRSRAELSALLGLQRCYAQLGQPEQALEYAQRAVALAPRDERARVDLGVAMDAMGRHAEAQTSYRLALASSPRSIAARSDLALSLALTGQFQEAIDLLTPMARSTNASPRVRQNLALVYGLQGDHLKAVALGQVDLTAADAEANVRFFDFVRARPR